MESNNNNFNLSNFNLQDRLNSIVQNVQQARRLKIAEEKERGKKSLLELEKFKKIKDEKIKEFKEIQKSIQFKLKNLIEKELLRINSGVKLENLGKLEPELK